MKCPKCSYTSFDYLRECKKCGELLEDSRKALNLKMGKPTLFAGLKNKRKETKVDEVEKIVESTPTVAVSSSSTSDFSASDSEPLSTIPTVTELRSESLSEDISSGLGTLGSMDKLQPRPKNEESLGKTLPKIELGSSADEGEGGGLELTPSFNPESDTTKESSAGEENKEAEFILFEDDDKSETGGQLEDDIPFEFSASDLESDISLSVPTDTSDKDFVELELDMEDEESLDQILADLGKKES